MSRISQTLATLVIDHVKTNGTQLVLFDGSRPASIDSAYSTTPLVTFALGDSTVADRVLTYTTPLQAVATRSGRPTWAVIRDSNSADVINLPSTGIVLTPASTTTGVTCIVNTLTVTI